jgi:hypothetical protein
LSQTEQLRQLRSALQVSVPNSEDCGILTGYVVISQWRDNEGDEWLMTTAGDINDQGAAAWAIKGWLVHTLDNLFEHFQDGDDD